MQFFYYLTNLFKTHQEGSLSFQLFSLRRYQLWWLRMITIIYVIFWLLITKLAFFHLQKDRVVCISQTYSWSIESMTDSVHGLQLVFITFHLNLLKWRVTFFSFNFTWQINVATLKPKFNIWKSKRKIK